MGHEHWLLLDSETGFANAARTNQYNGGIIRKGSGVQGQQRGLRPLTRRMHALRSISNRATNFEETRLSRPVAYVATLRIVHEPCGRTSVRNPRRSRLKNLPHFPDKDNSGLSCPRHSAVDQPTVEPRYHSNSELVVRILSTSTNWMLKSQFVLMHESHIS